MLNSEIDLISASIALGAKTVKTFSSLEKDLARSSVGFDEIDMKRLSSEISRGRDPLGDAFSKIRSVERRRQDGATYTPHTIIRAMLDWAKHYSQPMRVVDPGLGSGRFLIAAGKIFPKAQLIGLDIDPLATLTARANLSVMGFAERSEVITGDYRSASLPAVDGKTLYIGNPPYVRHHLINSRWKKWLTEKSKTLGLEASQLAGLHIHFFLATVLHSIPGDFGAFITSAEWLDVNYGRLLRDLFLKQLGGQSITVVEPTARPFPDAATTAAIATFEVGSKAKTIRLRRVDDVGELRPLTNGRSLHRGRLEGQNRWSHLTRRQNKVPSGYVELGELCRVHRGQVTGANRVWIEGDHSKGLPSSVLFRTVTKARELFSAKGSLNDASILKYVIDLPEDLSGFDKEERKIIDKFLKYARSVGVDSGYVASNRRAWWSVGLRAPAPILATYMARRPPAFVRNTASARHINIAHGLYPRDPLSDDILNRLARHLSTSTRLDEGRTYAGGLTKFEPREMERILVPTPEVLQCQPV